LVTILEKTEIKWFYLRAAQTAFKFQDVSLTVGFWRLVRVRYKTPFSQPALYFLFCSNGVWRRSQTVSTPFIVGASGETQKKKYMQRNSESLHKKLKYLCEHANWRLGQPIILPF
jgi:hypothetical protein